MFHHLRPALVLLTLFTLLTGGLYPLLVTGLAHSLFPRQAGGSLVERNGQVVGSQLIGQSFSSQTYFHGRPSATTAPDPAVPDKAVAAPYNAAASAGANDGPTSRALLDRVAADSALLARERPGVAIPVDLATASASGLDPDITLAAANFQALRVARARGLSEDTVHELIAAHTESRWLGIFGEPVVNVLGLNLALDAASSANSQHP